MGLVDVRPSEAYQHVFPLPEDALGRLAYFFRFGYADGRTPGVYTAGMVAEIERWQALHEGSGVAPRLDLFDSDEDLVVIDTRPVAVRGVHLLKDLDARVYRMCDEPRSVETIAERLAEPEARGTATASRPTER